MELPKLAAKLKPYIGREAGLEEVLYPIFKEINYLAYEELKTLNGRIEARNVNLKKYGRSEKATH